MKTFNQIEDKKLNELAVSFANGNEAAGAEFMEIVEPKLKSFARKQYSELEKEDLVQEFLLQSVVACYEYADRYVDQGKNIMGLVYAKCRQRLIDLGRKDGAEKRSRKVVVGEDTINREVSLQSGVGEDGESTLADFVSNTDKSIEAQVFENMNKSILEKVVKAYVSNTKGRNKEIIELIYKSNVEGWEHHELTTAIGNVLQQEGTAPNNEAIRQAKSRAIKSLRKSIESGKIEIARELEWEL